MVARRDADRLLPGAAPSRCRLMSWRTVNGREGKALGELLLGGMCEATSERELAQKLDIARTAGFRRVQVGLHAPTTADDWARVLQQCRQRGLAVAALGCYANLLQPHDRRLHGVALRDVEVLLSVLESADDSVSRLIVVWSGTFGASLLQGDLRNWSVETWDQLVDTVQALARRAGDAGCRILLEPYFRHCLSTPRDYVLFFRAVLRGIAPADIDPGSAAVGVVLDAPNFLSMEALSDLWPQLTMPIHALAPWAGLVHLKDIAPAPAGPRGVDPAAVPALPPPGGGLIAYPAYLRALAEALPGTVAAIAEHYDQGKPEAVAQIVRFLQQAGLPI
jgi:sugar phosphate isomerase/epimerase